jgi:hypothetical protein
MIGFVFAAIRVIAACSSSSDGDGTAWTSEADSTGLGGMTVSAGPAGPCGQGTPVNASCPALTVLTNTVGNEACSCIQTDPADVNTTVCTEQGTFMCDCIYSQGGTKTQQTCKQFGYTDQSPADPNVCSRSDEGKQGSAKGTKTGQGAFKGATALADCTAQASADCRPACGTANPTGVAPAPKTIACCQ